MVWLQFAWPALPGGLLTPGGVFVEQPLGIESAPLVQQLLEDLVVTTTNYEALRERAETSEQGRDLLQNQVYALRKEHARVTRENNQVS